MKGDGMNVIHRLTADIKEQFFEKTNDSFVQSIINHPTFNEEAAYILTACLVSKGFSEEETQYKILAALLIQTALETHDRVGNDDELQPLINKQLTVLAGDFYSGLYYKILADQNDIGFIRTIAKGTQEVNENKIRFIQMDYNNIDEFIDIIRNIETSIAQKVCDFVHAAQWKTLISNLLLFIRLLTEKRNWVQLQMSTIFDSFRKFLFTMESIESAQDEDRFVINAYDLMLTNVQKLVESGIKQIPNLDKDVVNKVKSILFLHEGVTISFAEEG